MSRTAMIARLARWLGPWASEAKSPPGVERRAVHVDDRVEAWVYRSTVREPEGALLVLPGLHYLGPADPRLGRFLAILADAGIMSLCPFLPDFRALRVTPDLVTDAVAAWDAFVALDDLPPVGRLGALTISFGSYPGIHLAGQRDLGGLVLFGGYADFEGALRFAIEGTPERPHDPLNPPVVFMALLEHLPGLPADPEGLREAWRAYVRQTWGSTAMKDGGWRGEAHRMAARLPEDARELFLLGCGAQGDSVSCMVDALARSGGALDHSDVRPYCPDVRCPVAIIHGRDDDVIPFGQAQMLADALPGDPDVFVTGLYAHTGAGMVGPDAIVAEVRALGGILGSIVDTSLGRLGGS